jgi:hypothetical protein
MGAEVEGEAVPDERAGAATGFPPLFQRVHAGATLDQCHCAVSPAAATYDCEVNAKQNEARDL